MLPLLALVMEHIRRGNKCTQRKDRDRYKSQVLDKELKN